MIPNNIFQIYHDKNIVPDFVKEHIKNLNPNYNYFFFNFNEIKNIILNNFEKKLAEKINKTIDLLPRYCHKSDLARYCLLYLFGGIYIDCDLKPLVKFDDFLKNIENITLFSSFGKGASTFDCNTKMGIKKIHKMMANGIFLCTKNNPFVKELIIYCLNNPIDSHPNNRGLNVIHLYNFIENKCKSHGIKLEPYKILSLDDEKVYLINQDESDKYGPNCFINEDFNTLINPNDKNCNFKRQTSSFI